MRLERLPIDKPRMHGKVRRRAHRAGDDVSFAPWLIIANVVREVAHQRRKLLIETAPRLRAKHGAHHPALRDLRCSATWFR